MNNPYNRTPEVQASYDEYKKTLVCDCAFCDYSILLDQLVEHYKHWNVLYNKFPYANTSTHLMLVPCRHITRLSEISLEEFMEWGMIKWTLIQKFGDLEDLTRSDNNPEKSVYHLHTHLIKYE